MDSEVIGGLVGGLGTAVGGGVAWLARRAVAALEDRGVDHEKRLRDLEARVAQSVTAAEMREGFRDLREEIKTDFRELRDDFRALAAKVEASHA